MEGGCPGLAAPSEEAWSSERDARGRRRRENGKQETDSLLAAGQKPQDMDAIREARHSLCCSQRSTGCRSEDLTAAGGGGAEDGHEAQEPALLAAWDLDSRGVPLHG